MRFTPVIQNRGRMLAMIGIGLWITLTTSPVHAAAGDIQGIGALPGGTASTPAAVNPSGQVVGYSDVGSFSNHAFLYQGGVLHDLGTLGGSDSAATGINASGQVVGYSSPGGFGTYYAFLYNGTPGAGGSMIDLGTLPGGVSGSGASGINSSGQVAGWSSFANEDNEHAIRYDGTPGAGGVMRDLGTLSGPYSFGAAINDSGQVAGVSATDQNINSDFTPQIHAFRYDGTPGSGGVMRDLGTLGGINSDAYGMNNSGQVVGDAETADGLTHAFRYDGMPGAGGVMVDLDPNDSESHATGINDLGFVVGVSRDRTVLWSPDGTMIDLNAWLAQVNPAAAADWYLGSATAISDNGLIVGDGYYQDEGFAYLLDASSLLPEPNTAGILLFILSLTTRRTSRATVRNIRVANT